MLNFAMVFPGQGSQSLGMMDGFIEEPAAKRAFEEAQDALGVDLLALAQGHDEAAINRTEITQPLVLAASVAMHRVWQSLGGPRPAALAGHSLGEYSALVAAAALDFSEALRLVRARAQFMQEASPEGEGAMAAVLGVDEITVAEACEEASQGQIAQPANFNSPGQIVIAGDSAAVDRAIALLRMRGARKIVRLAVSVPSHCAKMAPAAQRFAVELEKAEVYPPFIPTIQNATLQASDDPEEVKRALTLQLTQPVRWTDTVRALVARDCALQIECGPGKTLTGLARRIDPAVDVRFCGSADDMRFLIEAIERARDGQGQ